MTQDSDSYRAFTQSTPSPVRAVPVQYPSASVGSSSGADAGDDGPEQMPDDTDTCLGYLCFCCIEEPDEAEEENDDRRAALSSHEVR